MRDKQPVTQREYPFPGTETLLSTTDSSSYISCANAAFIRPSGYATDELPGQPHDLVRHPDTPVEAFADMWRSLKEGRSRTAPVKNRCKDGDHYRVRANAANNELSSRPEQTASTTPAPNKLTGTTVLRLIEALNGMRDALVKASLRLQICILNLMRTSVMPPLSTWIN